MDLLKEVCLRIAQEALKPPQLFDKGSRILVQSLEELNRILVDLGTLPPTSAEYVFFPLRGLLQQEKLSDRVTELVLKALSFLLKHSWNSPGAFELQRAQQLVAVTSYLLSPNAPTSSPDEESVIADYFKKSLGYRTAAYECLDAVLSASCSAGFGEQLGRSPAIAEVIMLLLTCLQFDSNNLEGQIHCIHALQLIFKNIIANRDHRALVLPKVVSKLAKFINTSNKRHFTAKSAAIVCLGEVIASVLESKVNKDTQTSAVINDAWMEKTLVNLKATFILVQKLQRHLLEVTGSRPELIESIFEFASTVYPLRLDTECTDICIQMLLLSSSQSINLKTSKEAQKYIETKVSEHDLEHSFTGEIKQVPSIMQTQNDSIAFCEIETLKTHVELQQNDSDFTKNTLSLLADAIERSLPVSMTKSAGRKLEKLATAANPIQEIDNYSSPYKNDLISLSSIGINLDMPPNSAGALSHLFFTLGSKSGPSLMDTIIPKLQDIKARELTPTLESVTLMWILAGVIKGCKGNNEMDYYDLITYCYEDLASSLDIQLQYTKKQASPIISAHTALCCYVIGETALLEGPKFNEFLVDLIHPLFTMLGNTESIAIREQAGVAISKVAYACGYDSPTELAIANKDYLVDGISFQLNSLNMTPGTFQALASLIYISGSDIIPYLDDLFASLFALLDKYHHYQVLLKGILNVFAALIVVLNRTIVLPKQLTDGKKDGFSNIDELVAALEHKPELDPTILDDKTKLSKFNMSDFTKNGFSTKKDNSPETPSELGDSDDEDSDDEILDEPDKATEKWEYPIPKPTYDIIHKISGYCDRLMTHDLAEIRLATLKLITLLTPYLAMSKDQFLPLVHKTWPEAVARIFDKEAFVVEQAINCINAITAYARDFVMSRIGQLWPRIAAKYQLILAKKWPQFSPERLISNSIARFLQTVIQFIPDISLETLESAFVVFRPALLRGEYPGLRQTIMESRRGTADLLWIVLLDKPRAEPGMNTIEPVYKNVNNLRL